MTQSWLMNGNHHTLNLSLGKTQAWAFDWIFLDLYGELITSDLKWFLKCASSWFGEESEGSLNSHFLGNLVLKIIWFHKKGHLRNIEQVMDPLLKSPVSLLWGTSVHREIVWLNSKRTKSKNGNLKAFTIFFIISSRVLIMINPRLWENIT